MKLLKVEEACEILNCSQSLLYQLLKEGRLPFVRIGIGKQGGIRIIESDLKKFIEQNRVAEEYLHLP